MAANNKYVQCNLSLEDAVLELKQIKNKKQINIYNVNLRYLINRFILKLKHAMFKL